MRPRFRVRGTTGTSTEGTKKTSFLVSEEQAAAYLTVQAELLGLSVHQMGRFSADRAREAFSIPDDAVPMTAMAIGASAMPTLSRKTFT